MVNEPSVFEPLRLYCILKDSCIVLHCVCLYCYSFKFSNEKSKKPKLEISDVFDLPDQPEEKLKPGIYLCHQFLIDFTVTMVTLNILTL